MSDISLFDVKLADELNIKLADRLSLITINVPTDVAQKQERLRKSGYISPDMEELESNVAILTNYLIQKSFISTIRSLVKSIQLADRLTKVGRKKQCAMLTDIVNDFLKDLYGYRLVSPTGDVIQDTGNSVVSLFADICKQVFDSSGSMAEDKLETFLAGKQREYIRMVLERARRLTTTIETIGASQAVNDKIESLLNKMETANLDWLIETYTLHSDLTAGKVKLPDLDNQTQREISNAVLTGLRNKLEEFQKGTNRGMNQSSSRFENLISRVKSGNRTIDLSQTNLLQTEQLVIELRLHISYRQQITILGSILDKVNEFSSLLGSFEAVVSASSRKALIDAGRNELADRSLIKNKLNESHDPVDLALAELQTAGQRPLEAEIELQEILKNQDDSLAKNISSLRQFFNQKTDTSNKVLAKLIDMGNKVRVMAPMVIQEAQHKDAQFTTKLIAEFNEGTAEIIRIEGSAGVSQSQLANLP